MNARVPRSAPGPPATARVGGYLFLPGGWTLAALGQLPNGTRFETGCAGHYVILRLLPPAVPDGQQVGKGPCLGTGQEMPQQMQLCPSSPLLM